MQGRLPGHVCAHKLTDHLGDYPPLRTPGPLGHTDAHDPNVASPLGDSPGPLGYGDYAEAGAARPARWLANRSPALPPLSNMLDVKALKELITRLEGNRPKVAADVHNRPVVGVGFRLDRPAARDRLRAAGLDPGAVKTGEQELSAQQIQTLLDQDLRDAIESAQEIVPSVADLPDEKQRVVIALVFSLGADDFRSMKPLIEALEEKDYEKAAGEMEHSQWVVRLGGPGKELVARMRKNDFTRSAEKGALPRHQRTLAGRGKSSRHTGQPPTFSAFRRPRFGET